jgi:hypothetical protein
MDKSNAWEQSPSPQSGIKGVCLRGHRGKGTPQQRQSAGAATVGSTRQGERRTGLMWAGGQGPRRRPWAETFSASGYGARAASQAEENVLKSASANDRAGCD